MHIRVLCRHLAAAAVAAATTTAAVPASATDGAALLASYQGNWRGSGEARPNPQSDPIRVSCKIAAVYDAAGEALSNKGKCGTTQGTRNLAGTLKLQGEDLTGDFLGSAAEPGVVNQRVHIFNDMIVSEAEMENAGKMLKLRTFFTQPKDGAFTVQSQFFDRAKNDWVVAGEIEFKKE